MTHYNDTKTQSLIGDFAVSDLESDQLSDLYAGLSETLEDLEEKRQTVKSLTEVSETLSQAKDYLWGLFDLIEDLETLEICQTSGLTEDLTDLRSESDRLSYSLDILINVPMIVWLTLTPIIISDYGSLEDRPEIDQLLTAVNRLSLTEDLIETLTEDLETWRQRISDLSDQVSRSRFEISETAVSLGIIPKIDGSDHGVNMSGVFDLETRLSRGLSLLSETAVNLEEIRDRLTQVRETVSLFSEDLETRQKRLTVRYHMTEDLETGQIIADSLRERVSISILDSGGSPKYSETGQYMGSSQGYGRHFERNQMRDFDSESRVFVDCDQWGLSVSINVYHFLKDCLDFDPLFDSLFVEYCQTPDLESESWLHCQHSFTEDLSQIFEISGLYGDSGGSFCVNTYNHESLLSQVLQYYYLEIDGSPRVCLSVHNGADVRGGYTRPIMFLTSDYDGTGILDDQRLMIWTEDPETGQSFYFDCDDGYHWYAEDSERLDSLSYDFRTRSDRQRLRVQIVRLEDKIESVGQIIEDLVTWGDPEDPEDRQRLIDLLEIRSRKIEDLEEINERPEIKYNSLNSLSVSDFRTMEIEDLTIMLEHDPESLIDHFADQTPIIFFREDNETGETKLRISGLGDLHFDFYNGG